MPPLAASFPTWVEVDLSAIARNTRTLAQAVNVPLMAVVKANAYGHGMLPVARAALQAGAAWLGVARFCEARDLRLAGIDAPILVFGMAAAAEVDEAIQLNVHLTLHSEHSARLFSERARAANGIVQAHLKVDTGMGRVGVQPAEAPALAAYIERDCPGLRLDGIFTHLPVSDDADPAYTSAQIARFAAVRLEVERAINRKISLAHCSNSGAVLGHPSAWMDMVRPGIMIYGFRPDPGTPNTIPLKPGLSFLTRVSFLKKVSAGTSIGYGRTWIAPEDTWVATIPAGYADGFNRLFSNMGRVLIHGQSYPIVGRVCMDQSMVNLGPQTDVQVGDEVVLIGKSGAQEISTYEWAEKLHTITYEVTCQINARVPRIYTGD